MTRALDHLHRAGIRISLDVEEVRVECTRVAGLILDRGCKLVGLLPAGREVAVPAVALQVARALVDLTGSPVAVVDAAGTWPAASPIREEQRSAPSLFATAWLVENLAVLTPKSFDIGGMLRKLEAALDDEAALFGHLVVDLTGFEGMGEHAAAMGALDAVALVARAGKTTDDDIVRWMREIPREHNLGVLLVGVR